MSEEEPTYRGYRHDDVRNWYCGECGKLMTRREGREHDCDRESQTADE